MNFNQGNQVCIAFYPKETILANNHLAILSSLIFLTHQPFRIADQKFFVQTGPGLFIRKRSINNLLAIWAIWAILLGFSLFQDKMMSYDYNITIDNDLAFVLIIAVNH